MILTPVSLEKEKLTAFTLYLFSASVFLYTWIYYPVTERHTGDFVSRLRGSRSADGSWIYWDGRGIDVYGPIFTVLDYVIHEFPLERLTVLRVLFVFYLLLNIVSSALLLKIFKFWDGTVLKSALGVFLIVNYFPLIQALRQDAIENLQVFALVLFLLFFVARHRKSVWLAATSLGAGICAKTFPIVLVPYLLLRRQYQIVLGALALFLAVVAAVAFLKGVPILEGLKGIFLFKDALMALDYHQNQAISGFVYRLFIHSFSHFDYGDLGSLTHPRFDQGYFFSYQVTRYLAVLLSTVIIVWMVFPFFKKTWRLESKELMYFEISILFSLFLLIVPHTQIHYFILILPAHLFLFQFYFRPSNQVQTSRDLMVKGLLILSYLFVGFKLPLRILDLVLPSPVACPYIQLTNLWNFSFYGNVILMGLLISAYRKQCGYELRFSSIGTGAA